MTSLALSVEATEKLLRGVVIPPRPTILVQLYAEMQSDNPSLTHISKLVGGDAGVTAALLKTVNSPLFGLSRRISSVGQAIQLLGSQNTLNVVAGLLLRHACESCTGTLEKFWDGAEKTASITAFVASRLERVPREEAYTFSLFHDCGIPLLGSRFADYGKTLQVAAETGERLTTVEERFHSTHHATVGFIVARTWYLPEVICEAIQWHHEPEVFSTPATVSPLAQTLIAVNHLAEHIHGAILHHTNDAQWREMGEHVQSHLGVSTDEYDDLCEEVATHLQ